MRNITLLLLAIGMAVTSAGAVDFLGQSATDPTDWFDADNWFIWDNITDPLNPQYVPGNVPTASDGAATGADDMTIVIDGDAVASGFTTGHSGLDMTVTAGSSLALGGWLSLCNTPGNQNVTLTNNGTITTTGQVNIGRKGTAEYIGNAGSSLVTTSDGNLGQYSGIGWRSHGILTLNGGTFTIKNLRSNGNDVTVNLNSGELNFTDTAISRLQNVNTGTVDWNQAGGSFSALCTVLMHGAVEMDISGGSYTIADGKYMDIWGNGTGGFTSTINVSNDAQVTVGNVNMTSGGDIVSSASTVWNQTGGDVAVSGNLYVIRRGGVAGNTGVYNLSDGTLKVGGEIRSENTTGAEFNWTGGTLSVNNYQAANLGGTLVNDGGTMAPGGSVGKSTVTGNYSASATSALAIELGGTTQAANFTGDVDAYDYLAITGNAVLDGLLNVSFVDGFTAGASDTFTILTAASITGSFSNLTDSRLSVDDGSFLVGITGTEVVLSDWSAAMQHLMGDANGDGAVDALDLTSVQNNFGSTGAAGLAGDANGDGAVDALDLTSVQNNFGNVLAASSLEASEVPEPATMTLLGLGGLALIRRRRRA